MNNTYQYNFALEKSAVIFMNANTKCSFLITINTFKNNWLSVNSLMGSILYLESPGTMIIRSTNFFNNSVNIGGCIYYNEISEKFRIQIIGNNFTNNYIWFKGGILFFNSKYDQIEWKNNFFYNPMIYNATTNPFRVKLASYKIKKLFKLSIIPGIIFQKIEFKLIDFFGQDMFDGTANMTLIDYRKNYHSFLSIHGKLSVSITNGLLNCYLIFYLKTCNLGSFSFDQLFISGPLGSKFNISIQIDTLNSGVNSLLYNEPNFPNEIITNNGYHFIIPVTMSLKCDPGQYYDDTK